MSWAEAAEGTVLTAELLSCVLPQVDIQVSFKEQNPDNMNTFSSFFNTKSFPFPSTNSVSYL